jgi:hypothetical protein
LIGILESLLNDGSTSDGDAPIGVGGGPHIWDGLVGALVSLLYEELTEYLPTQHPAIPYWFSQAEVIYKIFINFFSSIIMGPAGAWTEIMSLALALVITLEIAYWAAKNIFTLLKFGKSVIKLLAFL